MPISIDLLNKETLAQIKNFAASQVPFAVAVALTKTAKFGQRKARRGLAHDFTLRSKKRMFKGVRITPAKKADFKKGRIFADVYDIDQFLVIHATGGIRKPQGNKLAIPGEQLLKKGARTASGKMKKTWKPKEEWFKSLNRKPGRPRKWGRHKRPRPFAAKTNSGKTIIGIRKAKTRKPVLWLYQFEAEAFIDADWKFIPDVIKEYKRVGQRVFIKEMNRAIATMR